MSINTITISGNLTADPIKRGNAENPMITFSIAHNVYRKVNGERTEETAFLDCRCYGNLAKGISDILAKGMPVVVSGRLTPNTYQDKETGKTVRAFSINVNDVQLPPKAKEEQTIANIW